MVRPVHQAAEVVPLVHAAELHAISKADRYTVGQVDVMRNQQRVATAQLQDEALVTIAVAVIG